MVNSRPCLSLGAVVPYTEPNGSYTTDGNTQGGGDDYGNASLGWPVVQRHTLP